MIIATNAFSLNMLTSGQWNIKARVLNTDEAVALAKEAVPAFGHTDVARVTASLLELPDQIAEAWVRSAEERLTVQLSPGDVLLVAQYRGSRLAPGTTSLPADATLEFWEVSAAN